MGWVFWRNVQWIQRNNRQIRENVERETETEWGRKQIDRQRGDGWEQKQIDRQTDRENRKRKGENGKKKTRRNEQIEKSERDTPTYRVDRQSNTQWATFVGPPMKCPQSGVWDTTQTSQHLRNSSPPPKKNQKNYQSKKISSVLLQVLHLFNWFEILYQFIIILEQGTFRFNFQIWLTMYSFHSLRHFPNSINKKFLTKTLSIFPLASLLK